MSNVPTLINLGPGGGDPFDQLLAQVRRAVEGVFDILGEMGRTKGGNVVYLAREVATKHLVAMKLTRAQAAREFGLEVLRTLDESVPGLENQCPQCKAILADWGRFCTRCGADLSGVGASPAASETVNLVEAVKQATAGVYEILGKMDRGDGKGAVFFARDLKRDKLVALRLQRDTSVTAGQAVYNLGETQVFQPMVADLGATQIAPPSISIPQSPPPAPIVEAVPPPAVRVRPKMSMGAVAGVVGVALIGLIGYFAFKGQPAPSLPPPPPADTVLPPPPPVPPPDPPPAEPPPPPPPAPSGANPNQGAIQIGIKMPTGARVTLDGALVRGTRLVATVGAHTVAIEAPGFESATARLTVRPGETLQWRPKLVAADVAVANPPPPPPPAQSTSCTSAFGKGDWPQAAELCAKEANGGNPAVQRTYARVLDEGRGVSVDQRQAAVWYTRAAAGGDREAQLRLGYMFRTGEGVKRDDNQSAHFFQLAAEAGAPAGQLEYGVALETGKGVGKNEREAADWYKKAGAGGNSQALMRLGRLYERGNGVERSYQEAAKFYREAGTKGNAEAAYLLGKLYKDGKGIEKSREQAIEWFKKAAAAGHERAAEELKNLEGGD